MKRIGKSTVKKAWVRLDQLSFDDRSAEANGLLNAAAAAGLASRREIIDWSQDLPESTALEFEGRSIMLTFDPSSEFSPSFPVSPDTENAARNVFKESSRAALKAPLECLALKALEPSFEWLAEPSFPELEALAAEDASP